MRHDAVLSAAFKRPMLSRLNAAVDWQRCCLPPAILGATIAWPPVRFRPAKCGSSGKFHSCRCAVAVQCSAHSTNAARGVTSHAGQKIESRAAPFGAACLSMIVAWIVASSRNRGRSAMRRGEPDTPYCGENNDFIAECERADPILSVRRPRLCHSLSQLIRHLGDAGHGAFLVAFGTRSAHPHRADRLVANLDRNSAA